MTGEVVYNHNGGEEPESKSPRALKQEVAMLKRLLAEAVPDRQKLETARQRVENARLKAELEVLRSQLQDEMPVQIDQDRMVEEVASRITNYQREAAEKAVSGEQMNAEDMEEFENSYKAQATLARRRVVALREAKEKQNGEQKRLEADVATKLAALQKASDNLAKEDAIAAEENRNRYAQQTFNPTGGANDNSNGNDHELGSVYASPASSPATTQQSYDEKERVRQQKIEEAERLAILEMSGGDSSQNNDDIIASKLQGDTSQTTLKRRTKSREPSLGGMSFKSDTSGDRGAYTFGGSATSSRESSMKGFSEEDELGTKPIADSSANTRIVLPDADYLLSMIMMGMDEDSEQKDDFGRRFHLNAEEIPVYREEDVSAHPFEGRSGVTAIGSDSTLSRRARAESEVARRKAEVEERRRQAHQRSLDRKGNLPQYRSETAF